VAKLLEDVDPQDGTTQGRQLGSYAYMAPEQMRGAPIDHRSDIYALGVLLFELLTLRRAWSRDGEGRPLIAYAEPIPANRYNSPIALCERVPIEPRPRPSDFVPSLFAMDEVVQKAMAVDPEDRYASAEAFLASLRAALETGVPAPQVSVRSSPPGQARRPLIAAALFCAGIALFAARSTKPESSASLPAAAPRPLVQVHPSPSANPAIEETPAPEIDPPHVREEPRRSVRPAEPKVRPPEPRTNETRAIIAGLRRELASVSGPNKNAARLIALGDRIAREADVVKDPVRRSKIQRLASSSASLGDVDGTEQAIRTLEEALE
jgi:serine/threonine protein kinase